MKIVLSHLAYMFCTITLYECLCCGLFCCTITFTCSTVYLIVTVAELIFLQWTVDVEPKFHEDASKLDELVPFEECLELHSSGPAIVRTPEYLLLTHNGRSFKLVTLL